MSRFLRWLMARQRRFRIFLKLMPARDAWRLALREDGTGEFRFFFKPVNRPIVIRLGTSDLKCLEKVFVVGEYELPFTISPRVIVDAGANIGMATLYFARLFPDARILAIEPEPSNFAILQENLSGMPNVTLVQGAVWPEEKQIRIADSTVDKWMFTVTEAGRDAASSTEVAAITVPRALEMMGASAIDLLKLDIEGAELELFAKRPLPWLQRINLLVIELHDRLRPGCAQVLYRALDQRQFVQEIRGENVFVRFVDEPQARARAVGAE